ncbi:transcriptional regulator family: Histone-like TF [Penicillium citrinum]|uniref:Transcriptional regulator family: Histone-like TF n=2 Tax=Penicillium TaxID=5073 RepID=A0A9W9NJH4_PENCI|nr:transcriptional regulator family: Histone-like TF [Penicillium citrinum]KAJ5221116.1 transcriptional regulator family: Histone-like TF [Penicillium citrinum]KAJ5596080.1 transcriptional regulator family: Histone-like TF [Penicillium hetheringtonii]
MAATQKLYPRGTVKRIVKAHSNRSVSKNADILIFLDYMLFMQELMRETTIRSRKSGDKNISANAVRKVTEVSHECLADSWKTLRKFQG